MHLPVRFKDEAQFSVRNLKNLGTCLRGLRDHYQYYVPLALNIIYLPGTWYTLKTEGHQKSSWCL